MMMANATSGRKAMVNTLLGAALLIVGAAATAASTEAQRPVTRPAKPPTRPAAVKAAQKPALPAPPTSDYWVYVGAESADRIYRVHFGPKGATIEKTIDVGELAAEMEGPHGLIISRDGKFLYMTTGHGTPDGKLWKYALGPDTLVAPGILLGNFPASLDVTPDGLYTFSSNFNLHGDMVPSTISVVYTPTLTETARPITCTMPHGSRISPNGEKQYSGCMMDDQLVEIDTRTFEVSRRFSVAKGKEGPLPLTAGTMAMDEHAGHATARSASAPPVDPAQAGRAALGIDKHAMAPNSCSPTWAQPSTTGASIYVACNKSDEILEIARDKWAVSRRFKTGRGPYNLAVTPDGKHLLATLKPSASFEIFDLATGESVARFKNSTTVSHGVVASSDSRYAFVSSEGVGAAPGKVDVYDLEARALVATVDVGQQAGGIAFWMQSPVR
jgi:DNA-binding beta-propeller fold protein YncE